MKHKKSLFKSIFKISKLFFFIIKFVLNFFFKIVNTIIDTIITRLRFSITFKITLTYVFIFTLISFIMSSAILTSFYYYIQSGQSENYLFILSIILGICNIIGFILIIVLGSKASKKLLYPIKTMTETVKAISINELDKKLDVSGSKDELKDLAKTFNDMLDRIQKSVALQNQFVSDASHELRTPISVIQGYINLLDRWGKDDRKILEESILAIKSEAESMKSLIEKLLFLARGDKNTQKIEKQNFMLNELIDEILKETKLIDTAHHMVSEQNEAFMIYGDKNLIKEALRVFIDNSIKYTGDGGTIKLNAYLENNTAIIFIEDNGVGISDDHLPYIFNRFYRADESRTKESGGTGLGLAIAKWIIDHHNGKIHVSSKVNRGTSITITLPVSE